MSETSLKTIAILALLFGAVGLGFGAFATWQVQTGGADCEDGDDGDDGITTTIITYDNVIEYPCASEAAINNALTAIGTGYGIITITNNISLSGTITINGGGNYIIQGAGAFLICSNGQNAIHVSIAKSITIQNIKIDASAVTVQDRNIIRIVETSDNPVYIKNVHIIGYDNTKGRGIFIDSDNVWVSECYFYKVRYGVFSYYGHGNAHIQNNEIDSCGSFGIILYGAHNVIDGNLINNTLIGICSDWSFPGVGYYNIISNNIIYGFTQEGIRIYSNYTTVIGNNIGNTSAPGDPYGIYVRGSYNTIDANGCNHITTGYGIVIEDCTNNTVVGNTCLFNEFSFSDVGAYNTYLYGNQFF